jgi:hypothetical protein
MLSKIDLTDAFATEVAVVGASGEIEYANKKWNDTGAHGGLDPAKLSRGVPSGGGAGMR